MTQPQAFRAAIFYFVDDPQTAGDRCYRYHADGLLWIDQGRVVECDDYAVLAPRLSADVHMTDYRPYLILPGFIDTHVHYAQTDIIASHADNLLDWLRLHTYPAEQRFADAAFAGENALFFLRQLLANGTTTAMVYATSHAVSADAIFDAARGLGMRLLAGKVLMDRYAPAALCDTAQSGFDDSRRLIEQWHGQDRLLYAVTPRFAPTSSEAQLQLAQSLVETYPDVYLQSHVAENSAEVDWVAELFPWSRSYLDVYDHFGLLGERSVYAHCIHLDDADRLRLAESGAAVAFCPGANLFLGSGLLDLQALGALDIALGLGTDVGAGTSLSLLRTMADAHKVGMLRQFNPHPLTYFFLATLGGARALRLDDYIGSLLPGREADFIVIDISASEMLQRRVQQASSIEDILFALMILGDDRNIHATHLFGDCVFSRVTAGADEADGGAN